MIDWENFRSGPKEIELAFYLCWDYFRSGEKYRSLQEIPAELNIYQKGKLITQPEKERILYCLIPMWSLILVIYLNNGNLRFEKERREASAKIIPIYKRTIFDCHNWEETSANV